MAPPTPFHRVLCLVIFDALSWFLVAAKPIELPALERARHMSNLSLVLVATVGTGGLRNEKSFDVGNPQLPTFVVDTPICTGPVRDASGCKTTHAVPTASTITCSSLHHCSLDGEGESVSTTDSCYNRGHTTAKLNVLHPVFTDTNVAPLFSAGNYDYSQLPSSDAPVDKTAQPGMVGPTEDNLPSPLGAAPWAQKTVTHTATLPHDQDGGIYWPEATLAPVDAPAPVPGQKTVYVTVTGDPSTATANPAEPFGNKPLSIGHRPESSNTALILGSVFGTLAILCISIVSVDYLLRLRRRKSEEFLENQESPEGRECQECQDVISSIEDMSELLRQQQHTYGYYGTQRVASSTIVPQQMKSYPISPEPSELPNTKDDTVEKERRDGH